MFVTRRDSADPVRRQKVRRQRLGNRESFDAATEAPEPVCPSRISLAGGDTV
jgi:hypothetical protein